MLDISVCLVRPAAELAFHHVVLVPLLRAQSSVLGVNFLRCWTCNSAAVFPWPELNTSVQSHGSFPQKSFAHVGVNNTTYDSVMNEGVARSAKAARFSEHFQFSNNTVSRFAGARVSCENLYRSTVSFTVGVHWLSNFSIMSFVFQSDSAVSPIDVCSSLPLSTTR